MKNVMYYVCIVKGREELDSANTKEEEVTSAAVEISEQDQEKLLVEEVEKSKLKLQVCSDKLKCTVDKFEKMFIVDSAQYGYLE